MNIHQIFPHHSFKVNFSPIFSPPYSCAIRYVFRRLMLKLSIYRIDLNYGRSRINAESQLVAWVCIVAIVLHMSSAYIRIHC